VQTTVVEASGAQREVVANLFELYLYEFSALDGGQISAEGRFSDPSMLEPYWSDPQRRALLICADGRPVGFALIKRGSELAGDLEAMDLAEFFVLRPYRRAGVGAAAATATWDRYPGRWLVRVQAHHTAALAFWERVIGQYTGGHFVTDTVHQGDRDPPRDWVIYRFASRGAQSAAAGS